MSVLNQTPAPGGFWTARIEPAFIALTLGLMTVVTFANVVARYVFNTNILWALETTVFLFAWLVLLGASHGVKISAHIGVDVILSMAAPGPRKALALFSAACCLAFAGLLTYGAFEYWWPFATKRAWFEVNDIPMVFFPETAAAWLNEGEAYEKMPRFIPYTALPLGMLLLTFRFLEASWHIITGARESMISAREDEDAAEAAPPGRTEARTEARTGPGG